MLSSWHEAISACRRGAKRQSKGCSAESKSRPCTSAALRRHAMWHRNMWHTLTYRKVTAVNHWKCLEHHISVLRGKVIIVHHWTFAPAVFMEIHPIQHTPRATVQSADGTGCTSIPAVALWGVRRSCSRRIVLASIAWRCAHSVWTPGHEIYHLQLWKWHHMEITR